MRAVRIPRPPALETADASCVFFSLLVDCHLFTVVWASDVCKVGKMRYTHFGVSHPLHAALNHWHTNAQFAGESSIEGHDCCVGGGGGGGSICVAVVCSSSSGRETVR